MSGTVSGEKKEGNEAAVRMPSSPYFLSTNDNPGNVITQVQLKGPNYEEWARTIRTALRAKKKYGFIDGIVSQPAANSVDLDDWWTVNSMLVSWILNTIEPTLRSTITYMEIAKDLWDDIKERFSEGNGPRIHQLKTELVDCKQQGMTMVSYYGKLKMIWEELGNYEPHPVCKCEGCTCNIGTQLDKKREEEKLHQFLMGLDDATYGKVRSNILSTEPLPTLNRAYAMMIQEERVHNITRGKEQRSEQMDFAVQTSYAPTKGRPEATKDRSAICTNCSKSGHKADACFELIGYPDWWGTRSKGRGQGGFQQAVVRGRGRGSGQAHAAVVASQETTVSEADKGLTGLST